jgi:hypothetical protein
MMYNRILVHRYDIKGSWVARNFSPPTAGQQTYCRLCGQKYVVGKKKDKCSAHVQGLHAPNVILKDCDLSSKFQIESDRAYRISLQLERDSKFLMLRNIMDYSLLVYAIHGLHVYKKELLTPCIG